MNKIKNLWSKITRKTTAIAVEAKTAIANTVENVKGEFYIDKTVGIIICVVVGALLLGIIYAFINDNISGALTEKINDMWDFAG